MHPNERLAELIGEVDHDAVCLAELLCDRHDPGKVAFTVVSPELDQEDLTFGELQTRSRAFAAALAHLGVRPGDRVATLMGKSVDLPVVLLGIWRAGAVHIPLFTAFAPPAIALRLLASQTETIICDADQRSKLDSGEDMPADPTWRIIQVGGEVIPGKHRLDRLIRRAGEREWPVPDMVGDGDTEFVRLFTSGTTGYPKGVPVTYRAVAGFQAYLEFGLDLRDDDVYWNGADPAWAYGLYYAIIAPLTVGRRSILVASQFNAVLSWDLLDQLEVTHMAGVPTAYRAMMRSRTTPPPGLKLRRMTTAGEPLTPDLLAWGKRALGITIHDHFGQTELGMCAANSWHPDLAGDVKPGSMGRPLPGWVVTVLSTDQEPLPAGRIGRLAVDIAASPAMWFIGYVDAPEQTAQRFSDDGRWYITGDAGSCDDDGYVFFNSRDDDVIITGGYRIGPFEVEQVLLSDSRIAEAAVVGVPDAMRGQVIEAFVVLERDIELSRGIEVSLQQRVRSKLAAHAYPRAVHIVAQLPRSRTGLVKRHVLRQLHSAIPVSPVSSALPISSESFA